MDNLLDQWVYRGYHSDYDKKLQILATNELPAETWSSSQNNNCDILRNYITHTYTKLYYESEKATEITKNEYIYEDDKQACFNTGLFDKNWQPIYYYCELISNPIKQKWRFKNFYNDYTIKFNGISSSSVASLRRPNYFEKPDELIYNVNLNIVPQWGHILDDDDNFDRIPDQISSNGKLFCRNAISGAIDALKARIQANYKTVVPQWYENKIQLLAPLYLTNPQKPDMALVLSLSDDKSCYFGHTCLTMSMAYNNARLIARPDSDWLKL